MLASSPRPGYRQPTARVSSTVRAARAVDERGAPEERDVCSVASQSIEVQSAARRSAALTEWGGWTAEGRGDHRLPRHSEVVPSD